MIKKFTKIILGLVLMISISCIGVFALSTDSTKTTSINGVSGYQLVTSTGNLVVNNIDINDEFTAYKIVDTYYYSAYNTIGYDFTDSFKSFLAQSDTYSDLIIDDYVALSDDSDTIKFLTTAYADYISQNSISGIALTNDSSTNTASANVAAGAYFVLVKSNSNRVYGPMVGNIEVGAGSDNSYTVIDGSIYSKAFDNEADIDLTCDCYMGSFTTYKSYQFSLKTSVPSYPDNATNKTYVVSIMPGDSEYRLSFSNFNISDGDTSLSISNNQAVDSSGNVVATITKKLYSVEIAFDLNYVNSNSLNITYQNTISNYNISNNILNYQVSLEYATEPYGSGTNKVGDGTTLHASFVKLTETNGLDLSNIKFNIYDGDTLLASNISVSSNGTLPMLFGDGDYTVEEVNAPTGYSILKPFTMSVSYGASSVTEVGITHSKIGLLPITGGVGTIAFTIIGLLFVACAVCFIVVYRKRKVENKK